MENRKFKKLIILLGISIGIKGMDFYELLESDGLSVEKSEETTKPNKRQKLDHDLKEVGLQEESKEEFESSDFIYGGSLSTVPFNESHESEAVLDESLSNREEPPIEKESQDSVEQAGVKKSYSCTQDGCGKVYKDKSGLRKHIKSVHEGQRYACMEDGCGKLYKYNQNLQEHIKIVHGGQKYACVKDGCDKLFTQHAGLKKHIESVHEGKKYICTQTGCNKSFTKRGNLQAHIKSVHEGQRYACTKEGCSKSFTQQVNLQTHIKTIHEGKKYVCTEVGCDKLYTSNKNLQKHIKSEHSK